MSKPVNETSLERMITLQKAYIDAQYDTLEMNVDSLVSDVNRLGSDYTNLKTRVYHLENNFIGLNGLIGFYNFLSGQTNITPSFYYYYTQSGFGHLEKFTPLYSQALDEWVPVLIDLNAISINGSEKPLPIFCFLDPSNYLRTLGGVFAPVIGVPDSKLYDIDGKKVYTGPIAAIGHIERDLTNLRPYNPINNGGIWDSAVIWEKHEKRIYQNFVRQGVSHEMLLEDANIKLEEYLGGSLYTEDPDNKGQYICVHRRRPWETSYNKTFTIAMVNKRDLYLVEMTTADGFINPVEGSANAMSGVRGIMYNPGVYITPRPMGSLNSNKGDTLDYSPYKLPPTALAPCPVTQERVDDPVLGTFINKCLFSIYPASSTSVFSDKGLAYSEYLWEANINSAGQPNRQFPLASDMPNNSADSALFGIASIDSRNLRHWIAPGGVFAYNVFLNCLSLAYGTRDFTSIAGSGISSNDAVQSLKDVYRFGGISLKGKDYLVNGQPFNKCYTFNEDSSPIVEWDQPINGTKPWATMLSKGHPLEACMESQMVASFAKELGLGESDILDGPGIQQAIQNNESIPVILFYGNMYYLIAPDKKNASQHGFMTGNVCKLIKLEDQTLKVAGGRPYHFDMQIVLRMTLLHGMNLMGDIHAYCKGGYELTAFSYIEQETGKNTLYLTPYIQPDQTKWITSYDPTLLPEEVQASNLYGNIRTYIQLPRITQDMAYVSGGASETNGPLNQLTNSYKIVRGNYSTLIPSKYNGNMKGLNLHSGESYFAYLEPSPYMGDIRSEEALYINIEDIPLDFWTRLSTRVRGSALSDNASPRTVSHQETFSHYPIGGVRGSLMQILIDPDSFKNLPY